MYLFSTFNNNTNAILEQVFISIKRKESKKSGFIITDSIIAVSILFLSMYLFSTFNNNTNAILEQNRNYKELIYTAEVELNKELDNVKKGSLSIKNTYKTDDVIISKKVEPVDINRGVYVVTVEAIRDDKKITLQGYERWKEDDILVQSLE